jgi:hypothetical protein
LAEALSLVVRIEPALLRDVRLILFPRAKASLEADLYFSPLVSQRTTDWITLDPQLSLELQSGLTDPLKRAGAYRNRIMQGREAIVQVHRRAPFEIARASCVKWPLAAGDSGRSCHAAGAAKNRKSPVAEATTSAVNSSDASSSRTNAPPTA